MTAMWFGLAAIALLGAVALLYVDRSRRDQLGRVRQMWAKAQGYTYEEDDSDVVVPFRRAALAKSDDVIALDVVRGVRRGEKFVLFDIEETSTIVAVQRPVGSDVDIDLRLKSAPPPRDADMDLLGSIGPRVVFATDIEIARRVCDQRMAAFTESVPENLSLLWSESDWTLGSLPIGSDGRDWDAAIDAVARLSGMLHVLPPAARRPVAAAKDQTQSQPEPRRRQSRPEPRARQSPPEPRSSQSQPLQSRARPQQSPPPLQPQQPRAQQPRPPQPQPQQPPLPPPPLPPQPRTQQSPVTRSSGPRPDAGQSPPDVYRRESAAPDPGRFDASAVPDAGARPHPRPPMRPGPNRPAPGARPEQQSRPSSGVEPPRRREGNPRPRPITRDSDRRPPESS